MKEATLSTCVGWTLDAVRVAEPYCVFDLNAGSGRNDEVGCKGTPTIMRDQLRKREIRSIMWLCDKHKRHVESLRQLFALQRGLFGQPNQIVAHVVRSDNQKFVSSIPDRLYEHGISNPQGIVIADPNGLKVPLQEIGALVARHRRIDVAIHFSSGPQNWSFWRKNPNGHAKNGAFPLTSGNVLGLGTILRAIPKRSWLISKPYSGGGRTHFLLFGSNLDRLPPIIGLPGRIDMVRHDSPDGRSMLERYDGRDLEIMLRRREHGEPK